MIVKIKPELVSLKDKLLKSTSYDIRAYVGEPGDFFSSKAVLTPEVMELIGVITGSLVFKRSDGVSISLKEGGCVVIGYDNGPTSKALAEAFAKGLVSQGVFVYNLGVSSSGQVYHNQYQLKANGHVQITRSHVEVTTNGAKFGIGDQGIHTYLLKQMNDAMGTAVIGRNSVIGGIIDKANQGQEMYAELLKERYFNYFRDNPRNIAINLFGGTGLKYKELFLSILGEGTVILGDDIDVNSGDILADPTRKEMLLKVPKLNNVLASGVRVHSFDLDADRGSLTEGIESLKPGADGHYLGDSLSYILADHKIKIALPAMLLSLKDRDLPVESLDKIHAIASTIYVDSRYTGAVTEYIENLGGNAVFHRKGHSLWKETMLKNMANLSTLAGFSSIEEFVSHTGYKDVQIEASLHLFATDNTNGVPMDDAIENVFLLERMMDELGITSGINREDKSALGNYFSQHPRRFTTKEIRTASISNEVKEMIAYGVIGHLKDTFNSNEYRIIEFEDQIRIEWSGGFMMYGMSNTSPKLTFMVEGKSVKDRNEALAYILVLHNKFKRLHNDNTLMDLKENSFFIDDDSYDIGNPDLIDINNNYYLMFVDKMGIASK